MFSLATPSSVVRTQVAAAIASIAAIEIPRKEWNDLITSLCSNASNDSLDIRNAALQTLGFICEEIHPDDLTTELKNQIMSALI